MIEQCGAKLLALHYRLEAQHHDACSAPGAMDCAFRADGARSGADSDANSWHSCVARTRATDNGWRHMQDTEAAIGPYELQDFNLHYITRYGLRPAKVAFLA